jgi:hypothetical protein
MKKISSDAAIKAARFLGTSPLEVQRTLRTRINLPKPISWEEAETIYSDTITKDLSRHQSHAFQILLDLTTTSTQANDICADTIFHKRRLRLAQEKLSTLVVSESRRAKTIAQCLVPLRNAETYSKAWHVVWRKMWRIAHARVRKANTLEQIVAIVKESDYELLRHAGGPGMPTLKKKWARFAQESLNNARNKGDLKEVWLNAPPNSTVCDTALRLIAEKMG